jgi:hypothetical protein
VEIASKQITERRRWILRGGYLLFDDIALMKLVSQGILRIGILTVGCTTRQYKPATVITLIAAATGGNSPPVGSQTGSSECGWHVVAVMSVMTGTGLWSPVVGTQTGSSASTRQNADTMDALRDQFHQRDIVEQKATTKIPRSTRPGPVTTT